MTSRAEQVARLTAVTGTLVFLAVVVAAFVVLWGRCTPESVESVEARLGEHELLTTLLPDDATKLEGPNCSGATTVSNNVCSLIFATDMSVEQVQRYYRAIYNGRRWERLADNREFGRFLWRMEWRDETYKVVIEIREPGAWPGTPGPAGTQVVVNATIVERK